jgi:hypothetical protein
MRPRDQREAARIDAVLTRFHNDTRPLPGIQDPTRRSVFMEQLFESIHRVQYIERGVLKKGDAARDLDPNRANPASELFDPIKAAAIRSREGDHDEACWLVFLFTHFGNNLRTGYRLLRDVYGSLGSGQTWTWARTSGAPETFRTWLRVNRNTLENDGTPRHFGNHRKYMSLNADSASGTGEAVVTYVRWVLDHRNHEGLFENAEILAQHDPRRAFDLLYRSMGRQVASFGRTGRLDYLTMIAKLGLAGIEPGSTYMTGATGPLVGAKLLFGAAADKAAPATIDRWLAELEATLGLHMGMQILEDALCNWQKSPGQLKRFRG